MSTLLSCSWPTMPLHVPSSFSAPYFPSGGGVVVYEKLSIFDSSLNMSTKIPLSRMALPLPFMCRPTFGILWRAVTPRVTP